MNCLGYSREDIYLQIGCSLVKLVDREWLPFHFCCYLLVIANMFHFRRFNLIKHPLTGKQPRVKQIFVFNKHMIKRHLYKSTNVFDKQADTRFFLFAYIIIHVFFYLHIHLF